MSQLRSASSAGTTPYGDAWDRGSLFWYAYYGATFAISLLVVLASSGITVREKILASLALVAMACWYVGLGRVVTRRLQPGAVPETLYLGVLLVLFTVAEAQTSAITFILLALSPQCFFGASTFRRAVGFVVVFNAIPAVVAVASGSIRSRNMAELIGIAVLGIAFSVAFGSWITGIIDQSKDRGDLIEQLQATQAELAAVHREAGVLAERTGAEHDLPAAFEVRGQVRPLPASAEVVLLRVCQEALANVRKHAQASQAWVRLAYGPCSVRLEVADDGTGFDPARVNGGFGLRGMRGRVGAGGGTLTVRSAPGGGTSVTVEVPA